MGVGGAREAAARAQLRQAVRGADLVHRADDLRLGSIVAAEADALEGAAMQTTNNAASSTRRTDVTDMGLSLGTAHPTKARGKTQAWFVPVQSVAGTS